MTDNWIDIAESLEMPSSSSQFRRIWHRWWAGRFLSSSETNDFWIGLIIAVNWRTRVAPSSPTKYRQKFQTSKSSSRSTNFGRWLIVIHSRNNLLGLRFYEKEITFTLCRYNPPLTTRMARKMVMYCIGVRTVKSRVNIIHVKTSHPVKSEIETAPVSTTGTVETEDLNPESVSQANRETEVSNEVICVSDSDDDQKPDVKPLIPNLPVVSSAETPNTRKRSSTSDLQQLSDDPERNRDPDARAKKEKLDAND